MKILANPAYCTRATNPHQYLLYTAVSAAGAQVYENSRLRALLGRYDILHIHWPDGYLNTRFRLRAILELMLFFPSMWLQRLRGGRLVWTVHNLGSHDKRYPKLEKWFWKLYPHIVDGAIFLSENSEQDALKRHPWLQDKQRFVIPRGHYKGCYPDETTRAQARERLHLPAQAKVILFFGLIRPYKNLELLVEQFRQLEDPDTILLIAGRCNRHQDYLKMVKAKTEGDSRIRFEERFIPDEEMQYYLRAADLAAFPYRDNQNSGAALAALSFDTPVLLPHRGSNVGFQVRFGSDWVKTYDELTPQGLAQALSSAGKMADKTLDMSSIGWDKIAARTLEAYKSLHNQ